MTKTKERPKREGIMLCHPVEENKLLRLGDRFFSQPKLKGERCRIQWFHNEPILITSQVNEFKFMNHIKEALIERFGDIKPPLDGELYRHGWSEDKIRSVASRTVNPHPEVEQLQFHIFDYQNVEHSQWFRTKILSDWLEEHRFVDPLYLVPTEIASMVDWTEKLGEYTAQGYEGIILRSPIASYEMKRSPSILKFKPPEQDTYQIVGVTEGNGWAEGMLGAFIVRGDDGVTFKVGSGKILTKERRRYFWSIRGELMGKELVVKHEKLKTSGGVPVCAVAYDILLK